jgi:hypothetical protein
MSEKLERANARKEKVPATFYGDEALYSTYATIQRLILNGELTLTEVLRISIDVAQLQAAFYLLVSFCATGAT